MSNSVDSGQGSRRCSCSFVIPNPICLPAHGFIQVCQQKHQRSYIGEPIESPGGLGRRPKKRQGCWGTNFTGKNPQRPIQHSLGSWDHARSLAPLEEVRRSSVKNQEFQSSQVFVNFEFDHKIAWGLHLVHCTMQAEQCGNVQSHCRIARLSTCGVLYCISVTSR